MSKPVAMTPDFDTVETKNAPGVQPSPPSQRDTGMPGAGDPPVQRDELTSLLSLSGTLAGLCVGIVALINAAHRGQTTLIDDVLASCAAVFLLCIYLITFALRTRLRARAVILASSVDWVFLTTLTVMTLAGFFMVYTVW